MACVEKLRDTFPMDWSLVRVADVQTLHRLQSAATAQLRVPKYRLSTVGSRSFPVAGPTVWNQLPSDVTFASSLPESRRKLKTRLFRSSYILHDIIV